jgi:hypothetical protein
MASLKGKLKSMYLRPVILLAHHHFKTEKAEAQRLKYMPRETRTYYNIGK